MTCFSDSISGNGGGADGVGAIVDSVSAGSLGSVTVFGTWASFGDKLIRNE
jgi:hypothetical protein